MPIYLFQHPKTGEIKEIVQSMNDAHVFFTGKTQWVRLFTSPQIGVDTKINPFDQKKFVEKTAGKGTIGDVWDRASEWSDRRKHQRDGVDPIQEKAFKDYAKKRRGKRHPADISRGTFTI